MAPIIAAAQDAAATDAARAAAHDARAAIAVAEELLAAEVTAAGLPTIDAVSLTDVSTFFLRGSARFLGELAFQQLLVPYLIQSPFSRLLSLSPRLGWFGCVRPILHIRMQPVLHGLACFMGCFLRGHRGVFKGFVPTINAQRVVGLTKLKPDGCVAAGMLAFLYLEVKPSFVKASSRQDQCVLPPVVQCYSHGKSHGETLRESGQG